MSIVAAVLMPHRVSGRDDSEVVISAFRLLTENMIP